MLLHYVNVLPSEETLNYLSNVFSMSSLPFDLDELSLELNVSTEMPQSLDPLAFYTATPTLLDKIYDPQSDSTSLVLFFMSEALTDRCMQLREQAPNPFHDHYYPHIKLLKNLPPLRRYLVAQMNSYSDTFAKDQFTFSFGAEYVDSYTTMRAPDLALYEYMDRKASVLMARNTSYE